MSRIHSPGPPRRWMGLICGIVLALPPLDGALASGGRDTEAAYGLGKAVVHRELACDDCPLDHAPRTRAEAEDLQQRLEAGEIGADLASYQRWAVRVYLERRWDL